MGPREWAALVALAAAWGGSYLFIRVGAPAFGPVPFMAARVALAALVLWALLRLRRRPLALRAHLRPLLALGAINAALPFTLIAAAELHLTASLAAVLNATVPLFGAAVSAVWLGERIDGPRAAALLAGLLGVGILVGWSPVALDLRTGLGIAAMLLASASYAVGGVYAKRRLAGVPAATLALGQQLGALAWLAPPALLVGPPGGRITGLAVGALAGLVLLSTALAYLLYFYLIERVGPTRTLTVTYLSPAFGMLWGALFLGEPITAGMLAGFAIVLLSVMTTSGVRLAHPLRGLARLAHRARATSVEAPRPPCRPGPTTAGECRAR